MSLTIFNANNDANELVPTLFLTADNKDSNNSTLLSSGDVKQEVKSLLKDDTLNKFSNNELLVPEIDVSGNVICHICRQVINGSYIKHLRTHFHETNLKCQVSLVKIFIFNGSCKN